MKTFQLPTKDSTQALVKSYTVDLSHVDTVWCVPFYTTGMNEDETQDYTDIQTAVLYMLHKCYANNRGSRTA